MSEAQPSSNPLTKLIERVSARIPASVTPSTRIEIHPSEWLLLVDAVTADEPKVITRVFILCNAYESGYGHGRAGDDLPNPYTPGGEEHEAYQTGVEAGYAASKRTVATEPPSAVRSAEEVAEEFKRRAAIVSLGDRFVTGSLDGASVYNVLMYAAAAVDQMILADEHKAALTKSEAPKCASCEGRDEVSVRPICCKEPICKHCFAIWYDGCTDAETIRRDSLKAQGLGEGEGTGL